MRSEPSKVRSTTMSIAVNPEYETLCHECEILREELTALALEREHLCSTVIPNLKAEYQVKIGVKEYELFIKKCELQRIRRKIELIQAALNRMEPVTIAAVEAKLDAEFAEWQEKIERMAGDIKAAEYLQAQEKMSHQDHQQLQKMFRQIAKRLHPDINPGLSEEQQRLWLRASTAYKEGDSNGLLAVSLMLEDFPEAPLPTAVDELTERRDVLKRQINSALAVIDGVRKTFPLNQLHDISNPEWITGKQDELNLVITEMNGQIASVSEILSFMAGGMVHGKSTATH